MSEHDTLIDQAFAAGAVTVTVMQVGRTYIATLHAWRDLARRDSVSHTEHATVEGRGASGSLALREAIAKLRPTPAIEVREIHMVDGRRVVPLALAESTTRIKGIRAPEPEVVEASAPEDASA